jgi:acetyl-CoA C-acetyltransferase
MALRQGLEQDILITGWGHSCFGRLPDETTESLVVGVVREAVERADVDPASIDEVFVGNYNAGMVPFAFPSSLTLQGFDDLWGVPATRVENACASGSAAVHQGVRALLAGTARTVLVVGVEKMTSATAGVVGGALVGASYDEAGTPSSTGFAGLFAEVAQAYEQRCAPASDTLGLIAAKNHANGVLNPYAQLRKDLGVEFCQTVSDANPLVAPPLRRTDCSPVSDGAAALVLSNAPSPGAAVDPVRLIGFGHANDFLPRARRDPLALRGTEAAWHRALAMAEVTLDDLDLIELHDCFTIAELVLYEVLGLAPRGQGRRILDDGTVYRDGRLPVNASGGLKSKGHPVGATGVSQHVMAAMQLSGTAGDMQLASGPRTAAVHNMGGLAIANYVSVLQAF